MLAVLARLLVPEDFGLVAAAMTVIWFSSIFSKLGVGPALVQRETLEDRHVRAGFSSSLLLGLVAGGVVYALAPAIAAFFDMPDLVGVVRALAVLFPITGVGVVAERLLQRGLKFDRIAGIEVAAYAVGYGAVGIGLAVLGAGVWSLVGAQLSKEALKSALFLRFVPHPRRPGADLDALKDLLRYGSGYTIGSISTYFALQGDNLVIARFLGASALGLYGRAYELMVVPAKALGTILDQVLFPTMSRVQEDPKRLLLAFRRGLALVSLVVLPVSGATLVLAPEMIATLLGPGWEGAVPPLRILAFGMYFRIAYMVGMSVANATGAVYRAAWRNAVYAGLVVGGALLGQRWGIAGVAAAVLLAVTTNFLLITELAVRLTGLRLRDLARVHAPAALLTAVVGLEAWGLERLLEAATLSPTARLLGCAAGVGLTLVAGLQLAPRRLLGEDGRWIFRALERSAPEPMRPYVRRLLGVESPGLR